MIWVYPSFFYIRTILSFYADGVKAQDLFYACKCNELALQLGEKINWRCRILPLVTGNERIMANIARQRERLPSTDLPRDGVLCIRDESGRQRQCHGGSNFRDERSRLDLQ